MCVFFTVECLIGALSSDVRDVRDGHGDQSDAHDGRGGRGGRGDGLRPERILWLNNAMVCALGKVCVVQFRLELC